MNNFYLSENYTFFNLTISRSHPELVLENRKFAINNEDNSGYIVENMRTICREFLEPIIKFAGYKPIVLSGFRFPKLNRAVGGSFYSWHKRMNTIRRGAVDIALYNYGIEKLFFDIVNKNLNIEFHKMIYYKNNHFIHISLPTGWQDDTVIIKDKGKYKVVA